MMRSASSPQPPSEAWTVAPARDSRMSSRPSVGESVYQENLTAAESRIRDVDMADEMVTLTKNQILQQAGTAMLAQANQAPQAVLQLLRGS
jgi:flagellin